MNSSFKTDATPSMNYIFELTKIVCLGLRSFFPFALHAKGKREN